VSTPAKVPVAEVAYVSFTADVNEANCRMLVNALVGLVAAGKKELHLLLSTTGGSVMHGFTMYTSLRALPATLVTHNVGNIDSIGNVVFVAADERYASKHSTFMFHGVAQNVSASPVLTGARAQEIMRSIAADEARISNVIAQHTSLKVADVEKFFHEAATLTAQDAKSGGIVTAIRELAIPAGAQTVVLT
jgi:ATP-dependent protease ClpP protease subunit